MIDKPKCSPQGSQPNRSHAALQQSPFFWIKVHFLCPWQFGEVVQNKIHVPAMPPQATAKTNPVLARTRTLGCRWDWETWSGSRFFMLWRPLQCSKNSSVSLGTAKRRAHGSQLCITWNTSSDAFPSAPALEVLSVIEWGTFCSYPHYERQQSRAESGMDGECFPSGTARAHCWVIVWHFSALFCSLFRDGGMEFTISLNCHLVTQLHYSAAYLLVCSSFFLLCFSYNGHVLGAFSWIGFFKCVH